MKALLPVLSALFLPFLAATAPAATIYETGFETGDNAGFVVGNTFNGINSWVLNYGNQAKIVGSPVASGSQAAQITATNPENPDPAAKRNVQAYRLISAASSAEEMVQVKVSALASSAGTYTATISLSGAGSIGSNILAGVQFSNGNLRYRAVGGTFVVIGAYAANTFYSFTFDLDTVQGEYSLTIDGGAYNNFKISDIGFVNGGNGTMENISFLQNTPGESLTFDNISVATVAVVPEGNTAALLLLSGAFAAGYRQFKKRR